MKNELINLSLPPRELSCLVGNLFAELEPPCGQDLDPEGLILCGRIGWCRSKAPAPCSLRRIPYPPKLHLREGHRPFRAAL